MNNGTFKFISITTSQMNHFEMDDTIFGKLVVDTKTQISN